MKRSCGIRVCLVVSVLFAAGCASKPPTLGEKMLAHGVSAQELAKMWNEGNELFVEGEQLKKEGLKLIEKGQIKVEEADVMMSEGKRLMNKSEKTFAEKYPDDHSLK